MNSGDGISIDKFPPASNSGYTTSYEEISFSETRKQILEESRERRGGPGLHRSEMKIPISKTKTRKNTKEDLSKHQETLIDNNLRDGHERDTLFDSKSKLDVKKIKHKQKGTTPKDIISKTKIIFKEPESSAENKELLTNYGFLNLLILFKYLFQQIFYHYF